MRAHTFVADRSLRSRTLGLIFLSLCAVFFVMQDAAAEAFSEHCDELTSVVVRAGSWIDGFELICADGTRRQRGGTGGTAHTFTLHPGEVILAVGGTRNAPGHPYVISLKIMTNMRHSPVYGNGDPNVRGNDEFVFNTSAYQMIAGLQGRAGQYLEDVTAINQVASSIDDHKPILPPDENRPEPVQSVRVLFANQNTVPMVLARVDPEAGLVYQFELQAQSTRWEWYPVGTELVFGPSSGAPVGSYTVNANAEQRLDIPGTAQPVAPQLPAPPVAYTPPPDQAPTPVNAPPPAPVYTPPPIQTTQATISSNGATHAMITAGIGVVDESNPTAISTQYRTQGVTLRQDVSSIGISYPVVLDFNPQIYAWYENGSTYLRIDSYGSHVRVDNYQSSERERGFFIDSINIATRYPTSLRLSDYFPQNEMDSTQVSSSRSLTTGANIGVHPYSTGISSMLTTTHSASGNVPDFEPETRHGNSDVNTTWKLCGIPGQDDRGGSHCVYNEPIDLGFRGDRRWITGLSEVPALARNFSALRQTFVLSRPGTLSSIQEVTLQFSIDLTHVTLHGEAVPQVARGLFEIQTLVYCTDPESEECRRSQEGTGPHSIQSVHRSVTFDVRLQIDLAPLAITTERLGL